RERRHRLGPVRGREAVARPREPPDRHRGPARHAPHGGRARARRRRCGCRGRGTPRRHARRRLPHPDQRKPGAGGRRLMSSLSYLVSDSLVLARRNLAHVRQIPEKLLDVTLQPIMFVLLFSFVFGHVIHVPGGSYREYVIAGILVQTLGFGLMGPGVSIATDLGEGVVDRLRSLPISRTAYLMGHMAAEMAATALAITVLTLTGLVVGWRIHTDIPHALAGFALLFLFAFAM